MASTCNHYSDLAHAYRKDRQSSQGTVAVKSPPSAVGQRNGDSPGLPWAVIHWGACHFPREHLHVFNRWVLVGFHL